MIQSIMEAARETKSPVIVQARRGAGAYSQNRFLYHLMIAATEVYPKIPTVLHPDHGNSVEACKSAIDVARRDGRPVSTRRCIANYTRAQKLK